VLGEQLIGPLELLLRDPDARLGHLDLADRLRARPRQIERRPLRTRLQRRNHLALGDEIAALHPDRLDERLDRAADLDGLAGLDDAVDRASALLCSGDAWKRRCE